MGRRGTYILISILIHFAIAVSVLVIVRPQSRRETFKPIEIDLTEPKPKPEPEPEPKSKTMSSPVPIQKGQAGTTARPKSAIRKRLNLAALKPDFRSARARDSGDLAVVAGTDGPTFDSPQSYGLSIESYDAGNAVRGFLQAIFDRINNRLIFDSILAQYGHFGNVYVEFRVTRDGRIQTASIRSSAVDKILKVHSLRSALLPGLEKPLERSLWITDPKELRLRARFQYFRSTTDSTLYDSNPENISGFALSFRRFTDERPVARTLGRHLLNGGINYDLFAMYEAWQKYEKANERRRLDVDPFAVYRADEYYDR